MVGTTALAFALSVGFGLKYVDGRDPFDAGLAGLLAVAAIVWAVRTWRNAQRIRAGEVPAAPLPRGHRWRRLREDVRRSDEAIASVQGPRPVPDREPPATEPIVEIPDATLGPDPGLDGPQVRAPRPRREAERTSRSTALVLVGAGSACITLSLVRLPFLGSAFNVGSCVALVILGVAAVWRGSRMLGWWGSSGGR